MLILCVKKKKNLDPSGKYPILVLFAKIAAAFELLGVESSLDMQRKASAKLEDSTASKYLPGVDLGFWMAPQHDFPPLKSSKMTPNVIRLE